MADHKEISKLIDLCRKKGVIHLKVGEIEIKLTKEKPVSSYMKKKGASKGVTGELSTGQDDPMAKMPSDSDLLMWSSPAYDLITESRKNDKPRNI